MAVTSTRTRAALDNIVSIIEGTTPDNSWAGTKRYKHIESVASSTDLVDADRPSRLFVVELSGSRSLDGAMLQAREPGTVTTTVDVSILYPMSDNTWDLLRVVAEDVDRLSYRLMLASLFDSANTGIWRRRVDGYQLVLGEGQGDVATVVVPVEIQYRPTF